ncbi:MAG: hypothetical protein LBF41_01455 [Deltaproteobacteria bacterium]|jgi:hypothetical protein|nr:hypothetical protein [Deltaproteobacteria bacterium]
MPKKKLPRILAPLCVWLLLAAGAPVFGDGDRGDPNAGNETVLEKVPARETGSDAREEGENPRKPEDPNAFDENLFALDPETLSYFENSPPLTREDIDFYVEALALLADPDAAAKVTELADSRGYPRERIRYAFAKTTLAANMMTNPAGAEAFRNIERYRAIFPTEEEFNLARGRGAEIQGKAGRRHRVW